ncbi:AfsR/SARP family transcriptional regulator [Streptomyces sp. YIM 98790]|uniref:AfsR/SARP family transcriptional regulator n=1 Tax=Streptomyces sp. YIM 98790 TaxID=2689077 RepID=UPI00140C78BE|nr:AfsR/SARP family transcriptional regulator [Streptomyces sp. YIM 98790]
MEFAVLGPMEIRREDGRIQEVSGRLQRTLLGVLLAQPGRQVPVDALTAALWGAPSDSRAVHRLQLHVHRLRGALGAHGRLSLGPEGYRLRVAPGEVDAEVFAARVAEAGETLARDPRRAAGTLRTTLALWRGTPFADLDLPLLTDWARRLTECRLLALETLYRAEVACGSAAAITAELDELVRAHPLRERLHQLLMIALYRSGRKGEALAVYRRARQHLVAELGLEPGPELRELERRILADEPVAPEPAEPGRGLPAAVPAQLPADVHGFTGRGPELTELDGLLAPDSPARVALVAGTAGVGKTALAVRWAHRVRDRFPDGQLYTDLRGFGPDRPVPPGDALAGFLRALGLESAAIPQDLAERSARFRTLVDRRQMLIVLDNAGTAEQVRPLLPGSPSCVTVITSRDALGGLVARDGAHRLRLGRPPAEDARRLLRELLGDRVTAEPEAADALIERCARLPLALRIAAELIRAQPGRGIAELAAELAGRQGALDVLDIDGDPHTAVRAVFSWSHRRLDAAAARVFRLMGVHPWPEMDVHTVAAAADDGLPEIRRALQVLSRGHLVEPLPGERYRLHDLLRAYAAELAAEPQPAGERTAARARLRDHRLFTASAGMDPALPFEAGVRPEPPRPGRESPSPSRPPTRPGTGRTPDGLPCWSPSGTPNRPSSSPHAA